MALLEADVTTRLQNYASVAELHWPDVLQSLTPGPQVIKIVK
jgi:hypothetical protein